MAGHEVRVAEDVTGECLGRVDQPPGALVVDALEFQELVVVADHIQKDGGGLVDLSRKAIEDA